MDEEKRLAIANFRYGLIAPIVCRKLEKGEQAALLKDISAKEYIDPDGHIVRPGLRTLERYLQNLVVPGASYYDDNGHGTHVAGIIAAANIGRGIVGVAPEAELYAVKVLDQWGEGTILNAINAIDWCLKNRIHVANMSFGTDKYSSALEEAVRAAHRRGLLIVAAAGNDGGPNTVDYPSVFDETLSVAVVDSRGKLASFSSSGPEVDLLAPGTDIVSTYLWGSYVRLSGSSQYYYCLMLLILQIYLPSLPMAPLPICQ
ncbi:peptidase S8 [Desulforamulus profundi]|uniref:Peptidase S8 n=1 Tax=Desulforamulus profundi TaxID=1383067 RepID=A0A2C6LH09_9FIRM|nr:S8 family peptidase [Desulforamulus profundi]PHJ37530.1 peptidase S8 [Desulforamulus profundi]